MGFQFGSSVVEKKFEPDFLIFRAVFSTIKDAVYRMVTLKLTFQPKHRCKFIKHSTLCIQVKISIIVATVTNHSKMQTSLFFISQDKVQILCFL